MKRFFSTLLFLCFVFCGSVYAADNEIVAASRSEDAATMVFNIFETGVQIPALPQEADKPYQFVAYYPALNKYLLVNADQGLRFESSILLDHKYFINLNSCKISLYEWTVDQKNWKPGTFTNGATSTDRWVDWVGYGGCVDTDYGSKKILYSNFHVRFDEDNSIMYYKTPQVTNLSYQWVFSDMIQFLCSTSFQVLICICFSLLVFFVMLRYIRKMFRFMCLRK